METENIIISDTALRILHTLVFDIRNREHQILFRNKHEREPGIAFSPEPIEASGLVEYDIIRAENSYTLTDGLRGDLRHLASINGHIIIEKYSNQVFIDNAELDDLGKPFIDEDADIEIIKQHHITYYFKTFNQKIPTR